MSIQTGSLRHLPEDLWGKIAADCDPKTLYAFRSSCRAANTIGKEYMSEEVAARVIFHHPEQYRTLCWNSLRESRKVTINALTNMPELFLDDAFPEQFRADAEMVKTAFVAAKMLQKEEVTSAIRARASLYESDLQVLNQQIDETQVVPMLHRVREHTDLLQSAPFLVHANAGLLDWLSIQYRLRNGSRSLAPFIPDAIIHNMEVAALVLKKSDICFRDVFYKFLDNEEVAEAVLPDNPYIFPYLSARLRDNDHIARLAIVRYGENIHSISPRLQQDIPFMIDTACKAMQQSRFFVSSFRAWCDNEEFARAVVQRIPLFFGHLSWRLRNKDDLADMAIQGDEWNIHNVTYRLQDDTAFMNRHIHSSQDGCVFEAASDRIRRSPVSSYLAVSKNLRNIKYVLFDSTSILQKIALCVSIAFAVATRSFVWTYGRIVKRKL